MKGIHPSIKRSEVCVQKVRWFRLWSRRHNRNQSQAYHSSFKQVSSFSTCPSATCAATAKEPYFKLCLQEGSRTFCSGYIVESIHYWRNLGRWSAWSLVYLFNLSLSYGRAPETHFCCSRCAEDGSFYYQWLALKECAPRSINELSN